MGAEYLKNLDCYLFQIEPTNHSSCRFDLGEMKYHTSWDWLHPVWVKFSQMVTEKNIYKKMAVTIDNIGFFILREKTPLKAFEAIANAIKLMK